MSSLTSESSQTDSQEASVKFLLRWQLKMERPNEIMPEMSPIDEIADTGSSIKLLEHWQEGDRGVAVVEAEDAETVFERTLSWHAFLDLNVSRVSEED
ncbi:MAG: DUF3303 family protein [Planctomycetota bacterium]